MIKELNSTEEGKVISWQTGNDLITKTYEYPATAALFGDNHYVAIVEPDDENNPNNAVVYDEEGNFVRRITNPCSDQGAICFDSIYPSGDKLVLVSVCPRVFYECRLSIENGELINVSETR